jgi:hypothetical protein
MPLIADRYETFERIGGGGMADVFRAHDRTLDRLVAVKILRPIFAKDPEFLERFRREAEALGAIDHPNIVRVFDFGATADDGPYIVMELVRGGTVRDLMRTGRVDQYAAARIAAGIADGLEAAHIRGVLHRDLKPDNVLLDHEGRPKIADFGIARLAAATAITRKGELLGTPRYLAPEQMTGDVVDERADIYALGVILYEMLTGAQPTGGTTPSEIVSRRLRMDPRPPSRLVAMNPALNGLVMRALARDPAHRVRRAADLRDALLGIAPPVPRVPSRRQSVKLRWPSFAPLAMALAPAIASIRELAARVRRVATFRVRPPVLPSLPRIPVARVRLPSPAPLKGAVAQLGAALPPVPTVKLRLPSAAPLMAGGALLAARIGERARAIRQRAVVVASARQAPVQTTRVRVVRARRRSAAPLLAALALLFAFIAGGFVWAGARPTVEAPIAVASPTPTSTAAVLSSTSSPEVTPAATPEPTVEPTPEPTPEPTAAPTVAATRASVATVSGDPAGTIVTFYQLISGHDYATASGLWSERMRASYPPQTNIWGRFDRTSSIVARSASLTSSSPASAAVAVDLIETMSDGSVRHWVGTWYLVRSGSGWLLDQPGLRAA